jgi:membrane protease YdiL (CAAX protease family)
MLWEKPWRAEAVMQFCLAQVVCLCLGVAVDGVLHRLGVHGFQNDESLGSIMIGTLCLQGATWPLILFFLRQHGIGWGTAFGFRGPRPGLALLTAVGFILVVLPVVLLLQWISISALEKLGLPPEKQAAVELLTNARSWRTVIYLGVFAVVIAPVAEEFIFRGMLFPFLKQLGHPRLAWFGTSALFALIHLNAPTFVPLFVFALTLTWLYEWTDNLLAPITAHALFNASNFAFLLWQIQQPPA